MGFHCLLLIPSSLWCCRRLSEPCHSPMSYPSWACQGAYHTVETILKCCTSFLITYLYSSVDCLSVSLLASEILLSLVNSLLFLHPRYLVSFCRPLPPPRSGMLFACPLSLANSCFSDLSLAIQCSGELPLTSQGSAGASAKAPCLSPCIFLTLVPVSCFEVMITTCLLLCLCELSVP